MESDLTILGKFKSVEALKNAYDTLQKEFTKKCQKLSQLTKAEDNSSDKASSVQVDETSLAQPSAAEVGLPADGLLNEKTSDFSSGEVLPSGECEDADDPENKRHVSRETDESFSLDDDFVEKYVLNNAKLLDMVLEKYLRRITIPAAPQLIGATGAMGLAPTVRPNSVKEAGEMAERLFKK